MADFPTAIPDFRTIANKAGQTYDPDKQTTLFTEDLQQLRDEITAIDTAFEGSGHFFDDDVTVTEFFGGAVDLGTGGSCRVDAVKQWQFIYLRISIIFGTDMDIGALPLTILESDLPIDIPDFGAQVAMPGNFGALFKADNTNQMYAPLLNNVTGFGNGLLFFSQYGTSFLDYLLGSAADVPPVAGDGYTGTIIVPSYDLEI